MKTRNYSIMTAVILLVLFLTGCSNETENLPQAEAQSVVLKLDLSGNATRAVATPTTGTTKELIFNDGYLFFVNDFDAITKRIEIKPAGYVPSLTDDQVIITSLTTGGGHEIEGVPGNSTKVYMIGNIPADVTVPAIGDIKDVQALSIAVGTQNDVNGTTTVSLYGTGPITDYATPVDNRKQAVIDVEVIAGRIELSKLTALAAGNIKSFKIDGVYINRYWPSITLDGKAATTALVNNNVTSSFPVTAAGTGTPYEGLKLHDGYGDTPLASTDNEAVPATGKAWVYNVLAPTAKLSDADTDAFERPRIIVRLSDIVLKDPTASTGYDVPMYLTMRLKTAAGTGEIASFDPGKIYQIDEVEFDENNLYDAPEKATISVNVTVTLVDWTIVSSGVILN